MKYKKIIEYLLVYRVNPQFPRLTGILKLFKRTSEMVFTTFVSTFFGFLTLLFFVIIIGAS